MNSHFIPPASKFRHQCLKPKISKTTWGNNRTFDDPFWVLPTFDTTQQKVLSRDEFGIGADFTPLLSYQNKRLAQFRCLIRTFKP